LTRTLRSTWIAEQFPGIDPVADDLRVQLQQLGDLGDGQKLIPCGAGISVQGK